MRLSHRPELAALGILALSLLCMLPSRADAQDPATRVEVVNPVLPVHYEPFRPYQKSVNLSAAANANGVLAAFTVPEGFYLIVDHVFANIAGPNNINVQLRIISSFRGEDHEMIFKPEIAPDVFGNSVRVYVLDKSMRLYISSPQFSFIANRDPLSGFFNLRLTVVGHLVPEAPPR